MSLDPDETLAQIDAEVRRSEQRAANMPAFEAAIAKARGRGASPSRDILVQVDSTGRIVDIRLTGAALARGAQRLTHDLLATIRDAEEDVRKITVAAVGDLLGDDDPIVAQLKTTGGVR